MANKKSEWHVEWMPCALADVFDIGQHVRDQASLGTAETLVSSLHAVSATLAAHPRLWRVRDEIRLKDVRFAPAHPYFLCYRIVDAEIQILRVIHQKRDITLLLTQIEGTL